MLTPNIADTSTRKISPLQLTSNRTYTSPLNPYATNTSILGNLTGLTANQSSSVPVDKRKLAYEKQKLREERLRLEDQLQDLTLSGAVLQIFDTKDLIKSSDIAVVSPETGMEKGMVNDAQMGITRSNLKCLTCHQLGGVCPGHFGYVKLAEPILHPWFITHIVLVLKSICRSCGCLLLREDELVSRGVLKLSNIDRLRRIADLSEKIECRGTQGIPISGQEEECRMCAKNPKISSATDYKHNNKISYANPGAENKSNYSAEEILKIFSVISDRDVKLLGFTHGAHPKRFIIEVLPVIPPCLRPPAIVDGREEQHDLTNAYAGIVKTNNELKSLVDGSLIRKGRKVSSEAEKNKLVEELIRRLNKFYDAGEDKKTTSLTRLISKKEGVIRGMSLGKPTNYSARSVIGVDPTLKFGQVRIPKAIAEKATTKERVFDLNLKKIQALAKAGKIVNVIKGKGPFKGQAMPLTDKIFIQAGDIVERHLMNGDWVAINRQPTIQRESFIGVQVVINEADNIGIHMAYTTPANADFDGDEMNVEVPQTHLEVAEVSNLMNAANHIVSPQNSRPMMGLVYDQLSAVYMLTQPDTIVPLDVFYQAISYIDNLPNFKDFNSRWAEAGQVVYYVAGDQDLETLPVTADVKLISGSLGQYPDRELYGYPGRALFSMLLPADFYYNKGKVLIRNGLLLQGVITKKEVGTVSGSIVQALWKDYGPKRTAGFLNDANYMLNAWLSTIELSVGLGDCCPRDPKTFKEVIDREVEKTRQQVMDIEAEVGTRKGEADLKEDRVISLLDKLQNYAYKLVKADYRSNNPFQVMSESGAKGNEANLRQISAIVGQQHAREGRIMSEGERSIFFPVGTTDPIARGFSHTGFLTGLTPAGMINQAINARVNISDTSVGTSVLGYAQRKILKGLEDLYIAGDGSVRNSQGEIIQYLYDYTGFEPSQMESVQTERGHYFSFINVKRTANRLLDRYRREGLQ